MLFKGFFSKFVYTIFTASILFPPVQIGNISINFADFLAVFSLTFLFLPNHYITRYSILNNYLFLIWLFIIFHGIAIGYLGGIYFLERHFFPSEMWQYIRRMAFFYIAYYLAFTEGITAKTAFRILSFVIYIAGLIGICQIFQVDNISEFLASLYSRSEHQYILLAERATPSMRVYGLAGHSTAWGGFSVFSAAIFLFPLIYNFSIYQHKKLLLNTYLILGSSIFLLNVVFSASRSAIFSIICLFIFLSFFALYISRSRIISASKLFLYFICSFLSILFLTHERIQFLLYRFESLFNKLDTGSGRIGQALDAYNFLSHHVFALIFGVGNRVQRELLLSFGIEIEPVFIIVNYGLFGFFLRYTILVLIFWFAFKLFKISGDIDVRYLAGISMCSIIVYIIFSMGYFFFHELRVGTIPWLLYGWTTGEYFKNKYKDKR